MIILTRPQEDATHTAARLRAAGIESICLPLLDVGALIDPTEEAVRQAVLARANDFDGIIFVSPNAVRHGLGETSLPAQIKAYAVGEGTATALAARGITAITAGGAGGSEALFERMRAEPLFGKHFLLMRGPDGRAWLAEALRSAGTSVTVLKCYERHASVPDSVDWQMLRCAQPTGWSLTSSEAVRHLGALLRDMPALPDAHRESLRALPAWVSHPRIAAAAREAGFTDIRLTRSGDQGLIDALRAANPLLLP